jgi:mRNA-degrading endonuclease RelE of RelBE toxin-antitoxin system
MSKNIEISYAKSCMKFFENNSNVITENESDLLLVKAIKKIVFKEDINIDVIRLKGYKEPHYRVRKGNIRIIFRIENNVIIIVNVKNIDYRGKVYK